MKQFIFGLIFCPKLVWFLTILIFRQSSANLVVTSGELFFKTLKTTSIWSAVQKNLFLQLSMESVPICMLRLLGSVCTRFNLVVLFKSTCFHLHIWYISFKTPCSNLVNWIHKILFQMVAQRYHRICTGLAEKAFTFLTQVMSIVYIPWSQLYDVRYQPKNISVGWKFFFIFLYACVESFSSYFFLCGLKVFLHLCFCRRFMPSGCVTFATTGRASHPSNLSRNNC